MLPHFSAPQILHCVMLVHPFSQAMASCPARERSTGPGEMAATGVFLESKPSSPAFKFVKSTSFWALPRGCGLTGLGWGQGAQAGENPSDDSKVRSGLRSGRGRAQAPQTATDTGGAAGSHSAVRASLPGRMAGSWPL